MPEVTDKYIRIPARDQGGFQEGSFRTITLSAEQGIKAIVGRLEGESKTTVLTYLFDKEKWDIERAKAWVEQHKEGKADLTELFLLDSYKAAGDREAAQKAREARAGKYGIGPKEGGALTPPAGYPTDDGDYGDPVNYRYPIDAGHIRPAIAYFNQDGQQEDGGYSGEEWAVIGKRIAARASKLIAEGYAYKEGKVIRGASEGKAAAIKALGQDENGAVVGGYLLLWGDPDHRDLQGQYFTKSSDLWIDRYPIVPALFHHGLDKSVDLAVVGHRLKAEVDEIGVWVKHWIDKSNKFWKFIEPLLEAERLHYSPGSANHLVRVDAKSGEIYAYPVVEDTLTPIPAQHRLRTRPVEQIKTAYEAANLALPDLGGADAGASGLIRARAGALALAIEIEREKLGLR